MRFEKHGNYFWVWDPADTSLFLNWKQKRGDDKFIIEDNFVNRIVLGLPFGVRVYDIPEECHVEGLKDYQQRDVRKMLHVQHVLNANPMGLGKTPETIKYLQTQGARNVLIVTPKIIREQWVSQIERWWGRSATIFENQKFIPEDSGIWVVNYDKLRNPKTLEKFRSFCWDVLVLDEAHKIKSRDSKQTQAVKQIPVARRVALTGTPILRYVDDLWSILHFLDPRYSGVSYWNFVNYFCVQQDTPWGNKIVGMTSNPAKVAILNKILEYVSVRNDSVQVAHGKTVEIVKLPMAKEQRNLYKKEKALLLDELPENCTIANGAVLSIRLRQTTSWPGLFLEGVAGPKFEWILEMCLNNPTEKIVVFSVFEKTVRGLCNYLAENKVNCVSITGQNSSADNEDNKGAFLTAPEIQVLAGTIGAMGQGYDGLQNVSHTLVFIDREWSPEIMAQAEDRLHRMGQDNLVNIYYLECQGSFDQHVGRINQNKADDIRRALNDEGSA